MAETWAHLVKKYKFVWLGLLFLLSIFLVRLGLKEYYFPSSYRALISEHARNALVDPLLVAALISKESNFGPLRISSTGDLGLMQIQPSTLDELVRLKKIKKGEYTKKDLFLPEKNVRIGTLYIQVLIERITLVKSRNAKVKEWYNGNPSRLLLYCYNAGPTFVLLECLDKSHSKREFEELLQKKRRSTVKYTNDVLRIQKILGFLG